MTTFRSRRLGAVVAAVVASLALAGCTGDDDQRPRSLVDPSRSDDGGAIIDDGESPFSGDASLGLALVTLPERAEYVSFTNVAAVKDRLGFDGLTSESPTGERFDFWEQARADGAMLTGTRLYDDSSLMSIDWGWTAEDVDWEVDFSASETGCLRSMLCDRAAGYVLKLRNDLEWRSVLQSLADNDFAPLDANRDIWVTDDHAQPFERVLIIPELHAIASGNEIGVQRISEVVGGSPSLGHHLAQTTGLPGALGTVESAYLDLTGCVTLGEALGHDVTEEQVTDYFKSNDPSELADAASYGIAIDSNRTAASLLVLPEPAAAAEREARSAVLDGWPGLQTGVPLSDVASFAVRVDEAFEFVDYEVHAMRAFTSMVLTHDAPWALCASEPPG